MHKILFKEFSTRDQYFLQLTYDGRQTGLCHLRCAFLQPVSPFGLTVGVPVEIGASR